MSNQTDALKLLKKLGVTTPDEAAKLVRQLQKDEQAALEAEAFKQIDEIRKKHDIALTKIISWARTERSKERLAKSSESVPAVNTSPSMEHGVDH